MLHTSPSTQWRSLITSNLQCSNWTCSVTKVYKFRGWFINFICKQHSPLARRQPHFLLKHFAPRLCTDPTASWTSAWKRARASTSSTWRNTSTRSLKRARTPSVTYLLYLLPRKARKPSKKFSRLLRAFLTLTMKQPALLCLRIQPQHCPAEIAAHHRHSFERRCWSIEPSHPACQWPQLPPCSAATTRSCQRWRDCPCTRRTPASYRHCIWKSCSVWIEEAADRQAIAGAHLLPSEDPWSGHWPAWLLESPCARCFGGMAAESQQGPFRITCTCDPGSRWCGSNWWQEGPEEEWCAGGSSSSGSRPCACRGCPTRSGWESPSWRWQWSRSWGRIFFIKFLYLILFGIQSIFSLYEAPSTSGFCPDQSSKPPKSSHRLRWFARQWSQLQWTQWRKPCNAEWQDLAMARLKRKTSASISFLWLQHAPPWGPQSVNFKIDQSRFKSKRNSTNNLIWKVSVILD